MKPRIRSIKGILDPVSPLKQMEHDDDIFNTPLPLKNQPNESDYFLRLGNSPNIQDDDEEDNAGQYGSFNFLKTVGHIEEKFEANVELILILGMDCLLPVFSLIMIALEVCLGILNDQVFTDPETTKAFFAILVVLQCIDLCFIMCLGVGMVLAFLICKIHHSNEHSKEHPDSYKKNICLGTLNCLKKTFCDDCFPEKDEQCCSLRMVRSWVRELSHLVTFGFLIIISFGLLCVDYFMRDVHFFGYILAGVSLGKFFVALFLICINLVTVAGTDKSA